MRMKISPALMVLALAFLLLPSTAFATGASVTSRTYLQLRETVTERNVAPLYEYLDLRVDNIADRDVSFHAGGWLRVELGDERFRNDDYENEFNYAYVSVGIRKAALINLGRVYVFEGAVAEQIDGAYGKADLPSGFGVSVFGGSPVEEKSGDIDSNGIYGARVSLQGYGVYTIGVSYLKQEGDDGGFDREEQGIDIWVSPLNTVEVQGLSRYNYETSGWMEHAYYLTLIPSDALRINGEYSFANYEHFFTGPTLSVFTPVELDPDEEISTVGGSVDYMFYGNSTTATVEYRHHAYDIMGDADLYGGLLRYSSGDYSAGLSVHRMDGGTEKLEYNQYRVYASKDFGKADVTLDFFDVQYDEEINSVEHAYAIAAAVGYDINPRARAGVDMEFSENPFFDEEFKAFFKFIYRFSKTFSKGA